MSWPKKPTYDAQINWADPFSNGLRFATLFGNEMQGSTINLHNALLNRDFGAGALGDLNRYLVPKNSIHGWAGSQTGVTGSYSVAENPCTVHPVGASEVTILAGFFLGNSAGMNQLSSHRIDSHLDLQIVSMTDTSYKLRHSFTGQWNVSGDTDVSFDRFNDLAVVGWTFKNGVGRLFGQGEFLHTKTGTSTIGGSGGNLRIVLGGTALNGTEYLFSYLWDRALSDDEMRLISSSPYRFIEPAGHRTRAFVPLVGGEEPQPEPADGLLPYGHHLLDRQFAAMAAARLGGVLQ